MIIAIQIIIILLALICLAGGTNIMLKGSKAYLPSDTPPQRVLDNLVRFLSGIYFGLGFLLAWVAFHLSQIHELIYFIGIVVIFSGLGRLYSRSRVGSAGKYFDFVMLVEIALGLALIILQAYR